MTRAVLARKVHKWIALIVGVQVLLWVTSGFYMVVMDLDFIHGDPLVRNVTTPPPTTKSWMPVGALAERYPGVLEVRIKGLPTLEHALYEIKTAGGLMLVDAVTGEQLSPLSREQVSTLAKAYYANSGSLSSLSLITQNAPSEIQTRPLPLWRADFDDWLATSLYLNQDTGELVTRRHRFWRWFDFFWMLHIMDYESRENVNNTLLRIATAVGIALAASGVWLLVFTLRRRAHVSG